jgi:hypothetical protein
MDRHLSLLGARINHRMLKFGCSFYLVAFIAGNERWFLFLWTRAIFKKAFIICRRLLCHSLVCYCMTTYSVGPRGNNRSWRRADSEN